MKHITTNITALLLVINLHGQEQELKTYNSVVEEGISALSDSIFNNEDKSFLKTMSAYYLELILVDKKPCKKPVVYLHVTNSKKSEVKKFYISVFDIEGRYLYTNTHKKENISIFVDEKLRVSGNYTLCVHDKMYKDLSEIVQETENTFQFTVNENNCDFSFANLILTE